MNYIVGRDNSSETIYEFELIIAVKKIGGVLHDNTQDIYITVLNFFQFKIQ